MAAVQSGVWGIDLGQSALKALRLEAIDGEIVATAFDYVEHPKILSQPDADPDQLTRQALDQFLRNALMHDQTPGGGAALSSRSDGSEQDGANGQIQIRRDPRPRLGRHGGCPRVMGRGGTQCR